jgi:arginyl-tRNA synthetase
VPGYINKENEPQPIIIKKSDGGYLYSTTDLAAIYQRLSVEKADRILYVTDVGQSLHFEMIFKAANLDKNIINNIVLTHIPFGLVQGEDGKKFKTRSGETIKLKDLLNEAIKIATEDMAHRKLIANNNNSEDISNILTNSEKEAAKIVGISSVKYADLSMHRESNYKFSFKKMLSLNGNTAPYMLYVYARIQSIKMKLFQQSINDTSDSYYKDLFDKNLRKLKSEEILLNTVEELALAKQLYVGFIYSNL